MLAPEDSAVLSRLGLARHSGKPLCIDLFCGLGGWADGFLAEGYDVIGFDVERHDYGTGGYPGQLVLQDVLTLHGSQFRNAAVIVASPPCQEFSRASMPFGAAWREHARMDDDGGPPGNYYAKPTVDRSLFARCFTLGRQASAAAGHRIPLIVENVRGAQSHVGRAHWTYGAYYLWGDIPALMPFGNPRKGYGQISLPGKRGRGKDARLSHDRRHWTGRLSAAQSAKIPFALAQWIAQVYDPRRADTSDRHENQNVTQFGT